MKFIAIIALAISSALLAGCDRQGQAPVSAAANPAVVASAAPATQPEVSSLVIDQQPWRFPGAVVRLTSSRGVVSARLSSDDPPAAIDAGYHGNSFDLVMPLNVADQSQIDDAVWKFTADSAPRRESAHGLFLDGQRMKLHPQDASAHFQKQGDRLVVDLEGFFFESQVADAAADTMRPAAPPKKVWVQGRLIAAIQAH